MSDIDVSGAPEKRGVSRRTVTKAMAWAVPVVAVAAAAPIAAASVPPGTLEVNGAGCKLPGNATKWTKGDIFALSVSNTTQAPITIAIQSVTLNGTLLTAAAGSLTVLNLETGTPVTLGPTFTIPAGASYKFLGLLTINATNSQNGTLVVNYTRDGVPQTTGTLAFSVPPMTGKTLNGGSCPTLSFGSTARTALVAFGLGE